MRNQEEDEELRNLEADLNMDNEPVKNSRNSSCFVLHIVMSTFIGATLTLLFYSIFIGILTFRITTLIRSNQYELAISHYRMIENFPMTDHIMLPLIMPLHHNLKNWYELHRLSKRMIINGMKDQNIEPWVYKGIAEFHSGLIDESQKSFLQASGEKQSHLLDYYLERVNQARQPKDYDAIVQLNFL